MTNFNKRTNTLLYKNISLTLFSKGWCSLLCVRDELETGTDLFWPSSTSFSFWLSCSTVGHWGPKPSLSLSRWLSIRHLVSNGCVFFKYPSSQPIASEHDVIHTPVSFSIWGLLWQLWLSYPLRTSVDCTQCLCTWTKSRIVQSPTKLNDEI